MNQNPPNYPGNNGQGAPNGANWNYGYQNVNQQPPYAQPNQYQPQQGYAQAAPQQGYAQGAPQQTGYQQGVPQQGYAQGAPQQTGYQQGVPQQGYAQGAPQQTGYQQGVPQQGYAQSAPQQTGYQQGMPQQGYAQGAPQQTGYQQGMPQQGYAQGVPPQGYAQGVPQQGYAQGVPQGYAQGVPQGYAQGVPQGYAQGVPPQGYAQGVPQGTGYGNQFKTGGYQTGYGTIPQQPQQPQRRFPLDLKLAAKLVLFGVLPILFVLSMVFTAIPALKWVFVALAALSVIAIWVRPLVSESTRFTLSAVYGALAIVALVGALTGTANGDTTSTSAGAGNGAVQTGSMQNGDVVQGVQTDSPTPTPSPTPTARLSDSEAVRQLESFFYFWQNNQIEQMVELCAPSWKSSVQTPNNALFGILANRRVEDYETEEISGSENDVSRTATITATINKSNGQTPMKYRFKVVMSKENDMWYVDPRSLDSQEAAEETPTPTPTATPTPTEHIVVTSSTQLYYNPDGGSKYHSDANCPSANARYLPFKGTFTYGEINNAPYADLEPCNRCNAPVRQ